MVKKVDKESNASPVVKSGAKAARGLGLDKVKSAMTPDKVKISTPAKSEKKKVKVLNPETEAVATPTRSSKRKKEIKTTENKEKSGKSKETEEAEPKVIEENEHLITTENESNEFYKVIEERVVGKVVFYTNRKKYGFIKRNDPKDGDEEIHFHVIKDIKTTGLELKFDVIETKQGKRAVNIEVLKTPENEALKVEWEKLMKDLGTSKQTETIEPKVIKEKVVENPIKPKEDLVDGKSKQSEEIKPKVIEEQVFGKVAFYLIRRKYGFIKRNDSKDGEKQIIFKKYFLGKNIQDIGIPGLELKFDVIENEKGKQAVNVEVLKTPENEALKVEWEKQNKLNEDLVYGKSKQTEEMEPKVIEEKVVGKVAFYHKKKKYGCIKRKDNDKEITFPGHQDFGIPNLEVKFDVVENEKGTWAANIEMLETPENVALKIEWLKLHPIKIKRDLVEENEKDILDEGIKAVVRFCSNDRGKLEREDGNDLSFGYKSLIFTDDQGVTWKQTVKRDDAVLCDILYICKNGIKNNTVTATNIRAVDGGPLKNRSMIKSHDHSNVNKNVDEGTKRPTMTVDALKNDTIKNGVKAFLKMKEISCKGQTENDKENLFGNESDGSKSFLRVNIVGIKMASENDTLMLKAVLPHSFIPDPSILLIVKDIQIKGYRGMKADHEESHRHYMDKLREAGVDMSDINVMPLKQLKDEFKDHDTREHLAKSYDKVLVDQRLMPSIHSHLGSHFFLKKKFPVPVALHGTKNIVKEISKGIRIAQLPLSNRGPNACAIVANLSMDEQQISENVEEFMKAVQKKYPGGWINVRSVTLSAADSTTDVLTLNIYTSLISNNEVGYVQTLNYDKNRMTAVTDDLSTIPGAEVTVLSNGEVRVKRKRDSDWDKIEGLDTLEEYIDEDDTLAKRKIAKRDQVEEDQDEDVQDDSKNKKKEEDSDDDLDLENMEAEYMRKVAEEEEELERQEEENMNKLKKEENKNEEEAEELESDEGESEDQESDVDDDIEVENMVESDDDGSEVNDDNLLMERNEEEAEVSEDEAPKKKKSKKEQKKAAKEEKQASADKKSKSKGAKSTSAAKKSPLAAKKSPKAQKSTKGVKNGKVQKKKK